MIKISAFSDDLAYDWNRAIEVAQAAGIQGLEVRNIWGRNCSELTDEEVQRMARSIQQSGLQVSCLGSPYGKQFWIDDAEAKQKAENLLVKMLRFADYLGTNKIRVFALWIRDHEKKSDWHLRPRYSLELISKICQHLESSVLLAEKAGIQLVIEADGNSYGGTGREARLIAEALDSPYVGCLYHPRIPSDNAGELAYPDGYRQLLPFLKHAHISHLDYYWNDETPPIPYDELLRAMVRDGYDGWITVERYHPQDPDRNPHLRNLTLADIRAARQLLAKVQGSAT